MILWVLSVIHYILLLIRIGHNLGVFVTNIWGSNLHLCYPIIFASALGGRLEAEDAEGEVVGGSKSQWHTRWSTNHHCHCQLAAVLCPLAWHWCLASPGALEVMLVTESVSEWWLADLTDVTLVLFFFFKFTIVICHSLLLMDTEKGW